MIYIAICDDEKRVSTELESVLSALFTKNQIKYEIELYFSGHELCSDMEAGVHFDLIFLDIEFAKNEINGIEVGKRIRDSHHNNMVSIVYISWNMKYSMQLFDIRPLHFLIKPLNHEQIEQVVKTYIKINDIWVKEFVYKKGHDIFKVQVKDIVFIESTNRKLILHLADGHKEEFYGALKAVYQEQLKKYDFLFIHSAYVVNYDFITALRYDELTLKNVDRPLPISQARRKEVREEYCAILERRTV